MKKRPVVVASGAAGAMSVMGGQVSFLCRGEHTGGVWSLLETSLPKGSGPPPHDHPWDECYYVVEGQVRFTIEGREQLVGAGDFIYTPAGTLHGFSAESERPARMLIFDAPSHAEGFFREVEREVKEMPADFAKLPAIGDRHGIRFAR
jgi:quercetin dioxygenase-like cupin family protein